MGIADAACDLQPWLCLVVCIDSCSVPLIVGVADDASVVEVAYASVIVQLILCPAYRQVVFLAE